MTQDIAAEIVAEDLLYQTGKAVLTENDDLFLSCVHLPYSLETSTGARLITSRSEIICVLDDLRNYMKREGYVDFARTVVEAEFIDSDTIGSTHVSLMTTASGKAKRNPYPVYSIIRRFGRNWKMVSSLYAILDSDEHNAALLSKTSTDPVFSKKDA